MNIGIVSTIQDKCKKCYSCIRECPAAAIKVVNGQAAVIQERCIACGHCIKVCSQHGKRVLSDIEKVIQEILPAKKSVAIIAPSFPASFPDVYLKLPGALKQLGFSSVVETAFGADLISPLYVEELQKENGKTIISSACPAVVNYIEMYHKELVPNLAKIVSPMIAIGKYLKENLGNDTKIVFIGPCVAKKKEITDPENAKVIEAVLTFNELKKLFSIYNVNLPEVEESDFDPPHAYLGKSYSLAGGLLKTAKIPGDILEQEVIVVDGKQKVIDIIDEIANNQINAKFIDILFCEGCISGPAIDSDLNYYSRREKIISYIHEKLHTTDRQLWKSNIYNSRNLNLRKEFSAKNQRRPYPSEERIRKILAETNKYTPEDELNCGACGYSTCREYAVAIAKDLAEKEMCLPYLVDKLAKAYDDLKETQEQLQSVEKLASIGQLAAGVAHEINNPLGTILLYSSMLKTDLEKSIEDVQKVEDLSLIIEEANRCKNIVSNLLNFARQGRLKIDTINMCDMLSVIIKTLKKNPAYRSIIIKSDKQTDNCVIEADEDQLKQVFLNLINNAFEAMEESKEKVLELKMVSEGDYLVTEVKDSGTGIVRENFSKIFTPFFTTKKIGKGTGLGLAISYGIIKMHKGYISFQSEEGKGTSFKVKIPKKIDIQNINMN
ncbi:MAG: [Fe-Fe] hydrogenase large subunit C-terminal domain-containing protein [Ignavibacteriaceae bacterium]